MLTADPICTPMILPGDEELTEEGSPGRTSRPKLEEELAVEGSRSRFDEELTEVEGSPKRDGFSKEYTDKYNKYQSDYLRRLQAKYFSKKTFTGDAIFDEEITIENEIIRCGRWPSARSYLNPVLNPQEPSSLHSSAAEVSLPNRKNLRRS